jgi:hypothetical protein
MIKNNILQKHAEVMFKNMFCTLGFILNPWIYAAPMDLYYAHGFMLRPWIHPWVFELPQPTDSIRGSETPMKYHRSLPPV